MLLIREELLERSTGAGPKWQVPLLFTHCHTTNVPLPFFVVHFLNFLLPECWALHSLSYFSIKFLISVFPFNIYTSSYVDDNLISCHVSHIRSCIILLYLINFIYFQTSDIIFLENRISRHPELFSYRMIRDNASSNLIQSKIGI